MTISVYHMDRSQKDVCAHIHTHVCTHTPMHTPTHTFNKFGSKYQIIGDECLDPSLYMP